MPRAPGLVLSSLLGTAAFAPPQDPPAGFAAAWDGVRGFYERGVEENRIAGSSLFVVRDGATLARDCVGAARLEPREPVDEETIYHWASITKTFTAVALLQLRDRGLLSLDDPIVRHLPELRAVHNPHGPMEAITLRHLLTHTSGFRGPTWPWGGDRDWHPHEPQRWEQLVAMLPYTEIEFPPGSRFSYSNPGIVFLGRVIETLTTDDYEVYVDKNLLKPLGMHRTYFDGAPRHLRRHLAQSYFLREGTLRPARFDLNTGITVSNGGLNAPLPDMARWLAFLAGDPPRASVHDEVLARATLEEMFAPRVEVSREGERSVGMGLGFFVEERPGARFVGHGGDQNGFLSHFFVNLPTRAGYLVAYNTDADPARGGAAPGTRGFDEALKARLFADLFPVFGRLR